MIDPRVYTDSRIAKQEAGRLACAMGFRLLQSADGKRKQIVLTTGGIRTYTTWLGAYSWLYECWHDRQNKSPPLPVAKLAPPMAILLE